MFNHNAQIARHGEAKAAVQIHDNTDDLEPNMVLNAQIMI
jgi:hypothetical protein